MQPTFLPWAGYFHLMAEVNVFAILDSVQLVHRSWQTRNRILVGGASHWVTVPTAHSGERLAINETRVADHVPWRLKMGRVLRQNHARHPFAKSILELIDIIESGRGETVAELNIALIDCCAVRLQIDTPRPLTSKLPLEATQRTERLIEICTVLGCDTYVSPRGSAEYLAEDGFAELTSIKLEFSEFAPTPYSQYGATDFTPSLSIVDIVANLGWDGAAEYIRATPLAAAGERGTHSSHESERS